jgi:hypothetical protein
MQSWHIACFVMRLSVMKFHETVKAAFGAKFPTAFMECAAAR